MVVKLKDEDLSKVSGGYIIIEKDYETGEVYASVHDDISHSVIIVERLFGYQAPHLHVLLDSEIIEALRAIDEDYNCNNHT